MEIKAEIVCVGRVSLTYLSIDWHQVQGKQEEEEEDESATTLFLKSVLLGSSLGRFWSSKISAPTQVSLSVPVTVSHKTKRCRESAKENRLIQLRLEFK